MKMYSFGYGDSLDKLFTAGRVIHFVEDFFDLDFRVGLHGCSEGFQQSADGMNQSAAFLIFSCCDD